MIISPPKSIDNIAKYWNVTGWSLFSILDKNNNLFFGQDPLSDCSNLMSGYSKSVKLDINGKYILLGENYKNAPVYVSNKQNFLVVGPEYPFGVDISTINTDMLITNPEYEIVRDGPYLLGKFGKNGTWAIVKLPPASGNDYIDILTLNLSIFNNEFDNLIIVNQIIDHPPASMKDYTEKTYRTDNSNLTNKKQSWINSVSPLSRPWTINKFVANNIRCNRNSYAPTQPEAATKHFDTSESSITTKVTRHPSKIPSSKLFYEKVYDEYKALKKLLADIDIIHAPSLYDFNIHITNNNNINYDECLFPLGNTKGGEQITNLKINGRFLKTSNFKTLIYSGYYNINSIEILIEDSSSYTTVTMNDIDSKTRYVIQYIQQSMTDWCRNTAFLYKPPVCSKDWITKVKDYNYIYSLSGSTYPQHLSKMSRYGFYNDLDRNMYDRLYQLLQIKGSL